MIRSFLPFRPSLAAVEPYPDRDDRAVEFLTRAPELAPEGVETLVSLGDAHLALGRVDDAERWARAALEAEPEHADALVLMGHVLPRRGDVTGARARGLGDPHGRERSGR
ncbi:tetratricopeptide repeat protein [Sorangium sp. So ce854]|uniref:tetratricopeptide repeat protein n=1 Tax=Sorangium sp. So ce854 TaxID=3133322 RepID=UPI003F613088